MLDTYATLKPVLANISMMNLIISNLTSSLTLGAHLDLLEVKRVHQHVWYVVRAVMRVRQIYPF